MNHTIWSTILLIIFIGCKETQSEKTVNTSESPEASIPTISPFELGIDSLRLNDLTTKIEKQEYPNIHSVLIAKNGSVFYEKYFQGQDQIYGRSIGTIKFSDSTLHDIRSISKSIIATCIGIAIEKKYIKSVDQKISDFFPEMDSIFVGNKTNWTIQQFLTMTTGLTWNEDVPYDNPENDEAQMAIDPYPINYVLKQPLEATPGAVFNYNGGATQILAEIIERSSKTPLDNFVKEYLFNPLGIKKFEWTKYSVWEGADKFAAAAGLRLTAQDLMKIGLMYRNKGNWNGHQIIPSNWVSESFTAFIEFPSKVAAANDAYGYQFWIWPDLFQNNEFEMIAANGNGGQNIYWDLKNDLIVITTAGNYNKWDIQNDTYALLKNEIYPLSLKE